jgi:diacylglycerol kinase family enzyme
MTAAQSLKLYDIPGKYFKDPEDTHAVVTQIEQVVEDKLESKKGIFLTKDDKIDLIDRINKSKVETIIWIVGTGIVQVILSILAKKFL